MKKTILLLVAGIFLSALTNAQCPIFYDGFESGTFTTPWTAGAGAYTYTVVSSSPAVGVYDLNVASSASGAFYAGAMATFLPSQPTYVSWWARTNTLSAANGYFVLGDADIDVNNGILFAYFSSSGNLRFYGTSGYDYPATANTWYHIEAKEINWGTRTMDIYVNGTLILDDWPFRSTTTTAVDQLHLFNLNAGSPEYDEIIIGYTPIDLAPSQTNNFCFGDSTGSASVNATGGTGTLTYLWAPGGDTTGMLTGLMAQTYTCTVTDALGCSAIQAFTITQAQEISTIIDTAICFGTSILIGTSTYSANGNYTDYFTALNGCDSVVYTDLTVEAAVDVTTTLIGAVVTANQAGAGYQWIDCDNGNLPIAGEVSQSFTAITGGNFAVVVSMGNCSDTSNCVNVTFTSNGQITSMHEIMIYPNPGQGKFIIESVPPNTLMSVFNAQGAFVCSALSGEAKTIIDLSAFASGIYCLKISGDISAKTFKLIKE